METVESSRCDDENEMMGKERGGAQTPGPGLAGRRWNRRDR